MTPVVVHAQAEPIGGVQASETETCEICSDSAAASSDSEEASLVLQGPYHADEHEAIRSLERDIGPHLIMNKSVPGLQPLNSRSQYETWDSQPLPSHWSEFKLTNLRPSSWKKTVTIWWEHRVIHSQQTELRDARVQGVEIALC